MASPFMNDDELEKFYAYMNQIRQQYLNPTIPTPNQVNSSYGPSPITSHGWPKQSTGISPTDVDARGMFPYQSPERDEQGNYYGYKILVRKNTGCDCPECSCLQSPRYPARWMNGVLTADYEPNERRMCGIHFTKRPDHPELRNYVRDYPEQYMSYFLVRCQLFPVIVETEQGYRVQHAKITEVLFNGNWTSYQDYSRPSKRYADYYTFEEGRRIWDEGITDGSKFNSLP